MQAEIQEILNVRNGLSDLLQIVILAFSETMNEWGFFLPPVIGDP